jgi:hypothetical protein
MLTHPGPPRRNSAQGPRRLRSVLATPARSGSASAGCAPSRSASALRVLTYQIPGARAAPPPPKAERRRSIADRDSGSGPGRGSGDAAWTGGGQVLHGPCAVRSRAGAAGTAGDSGEGARR